MYVMSVAWKIPEAKKSLTVEMSGSQYSYASSTATTRSAEKRPLEGRFNESGYWEAANTATAPASTVPSAEDQASSRHSPDVRSGCEHSNDPVGCLMELQLCMIHNTQYHARLILYSHIAVCT